jgi:surface antigen
MKLSQFDTVRAHIANYKELVGALDAASYGSIDVTVYGTECGNVDDVVYNVKLLTSVAECREAIKTVLRHHIADAKQALATYGVDIDE